MTEENLLFQTGFEENTTIVKNIFSGKDHTIRKSDWKSDLGTFARSAYLNFDKNDSTQRFAKIIPEPGNTGNKVLTFRVNEGWTDGRNARVQYDLYGITSGLKEFAQSERIFISGDFGLLRQYPEKIHWLTIVEIWNNITWSQSVPYGFRITLGLGKPVETESDLYFILDAQDCELFEDGKQKYTTLWAEINENVKIPLNEWFTLNYYFKEGNAKSGRFIMTIDTKKNGLQTIFDVTNFTHNTMDGEPDGVTAFNPFKLYTSAKLANWMKEQGKPLQIYWDDFKLWGKN